MKKMTEAWDQELSGRICQLPFGNEKRPWADENQLNMPRSTVDPQTLGRFLQTLVMGFELHAPGIETYLLEESWLWVRTFPYRRKVRQNIMPRSLLP